ncbi:MAG TPA: DUF6572 domain-containing protein [Gemmataceae bacterium]|nr:DUF6572 domain-containing protein [Gemmataceae bacterium]
MADKKKPAFPRPKWPPIQDLESVDLVAKRKDGGVDLHIVASQPLDDADDTLDSIRDKVSYYLDVIDLDEFQEEMGHPPRSKTCIMLSCDHLIHPRAEAVIAECQAATRNRGVKLVVQRQEA